MKIIFLNIWGGKIYEPLIDFLRAQARDTDFFCLQEVLDSPEKNRTTSWGGRADIYKDLCATLTDFAPYYSVSVKDFDGDEYTDFPLAHGNAIFAKKHIAVTSHGDFLVGGAGWPDEGGIRTFPHKLHYIRFEKDGRAYTLANVHGLAYPGTKRDTPERIAQSQKIIDFLATEQSEKILGGDFNLMPDTESIRMIEGAGTGMRNLITDFAITTTRSAFSYGQYPEGDRQYFADFAFVSRGIRISDFRVPQKEISDHLPLILECA